LSFDVNFLTPGELNVSPPAPETFRDRRCAHVFVLSVVHRQQH